MKPNGIGRWKPFCSSTKDAYRNLQRVFVNNTISRKFQLRQEFHNIQQRGMSIIDYTMKIKEMCDSLGSINMTKDEEDIVRISL